MAPPEQPTSGDPAALLRDGSLAGEWTLDPARSQALLNMRHSWGLLPLHGSFREVAGSGSVTADGQVSGTITIGAGSVDTKNPRRDKHLRSAAFFDADNHPHFTFAAESASPARDRVAIAGQLTVRDTTRPATFEARVTVAGDQVELDGELTVDRSDYGLTWNFLGIAAMRSVIAVHAVFIRA